MRYVEPQPSTATPTPVRSTERIQSLDVLRGFALLGILLLNILGFGLHSAGYFNPLIGSGVTELDRIINLSVWATVSVFFEGAMRCLFSMLFGAGIVLFTTGAGAKSVALHYRRNFWLLVFGVIDAYLLLWSGDILITYAIAGALLFAMRQWPPRRLLLLAGVLIVMMSLFYGVTGSEMERARAAGDPAWESFSADYLPTPEAYEEQLEQRRSGYGGAFAHNLQEKVYMTLFVLPVYLLWDAIAMMLIGMALYKMQVLDASRPRDYYRHMAVIGFGVGVTVNLYELYPVLTSNFDLLAAMPLTQATYHIGRLGMALGYLAVVMLVCQSLMLINLRMRLAAVGRMALTNYLSHSLICLVLFTGVGFGLVGVLQRWQLYLVVFAIWVFQLWFSPWWLQRYHYGPMEWLWRTLTYGRKPR